MQIIDGICICELSDVYKIFEGMKANVLIQFAFGKVSLASNLQPIHGPMLALDAATSPAFHERQTALFALATEVRVAVLAVGSADQATNAVISSGRNAQVFAFEKSETTVAFFATVLHFYEPTTEQFNGP